MWQRMRRTIQFGVLVVVAVAALASNASASITPALNLDQSAGTAAGSTTNLGVNLSFSPTGTDSPQDMTLTLPPGLLANASIDGGNCLKTADLNDSACEVGSGTVTAVAEQIARITHRSRSTSCRRLTRATSPASPSTAVARRSATRPTSRSGRRATRTGSASRSTSCCRTRCSASRS